MNGQTYTKSLKNDGQAENYVQRSVKFIAIYTNTMYSHDCPFLKYPLHSLSMFDVAHLTVSTCLHVDTTDNPICQ